MTDFLDDKKKEIETRLRELKPLVDEFNRLEAASAALQGVSTGPASRAATRRASPNGRRRTSGGGRRGRPRGTGKRAQEAEKLVKSKPGITIPELASSMGIQANYLYRVMPGLQKDGKVRKKGKGWHPA